MRLSAARNRHKIDRLSALHCARLWILLGRAKKVYRRWNTQNKENTTERVIKKGRNWSVAKIMRKENWVCMCIKVKLFHHRNFLFSRVQLITTFAKLRPGYMARAERGSAAHTIALLINNNNSNDDEKSASLRWAHASVLEFASQILPRDGKLIHFLSLCMGFFPSTHLRVVDVASSARGDHTLADIEFQNCFFGPLFSFLELLMMIVCIHSTG